MRILELFSGTGSATRFFAERGHEIRSLDNGDEWGKTPWGTPTYSLDIREFARNPDQWLNGWRPDFIWASVPCQKFSVGSIGKYWNHDHTPKHPDSQEALGILNATMRIIQRLNPDWYLIENPRGKMRRIVEKYWPDVHRYETGWCPYHGERDTGPRRKKPTDLFGRMPPGWKPRPLCANGDPCHIAAVRGSTTGTQGMDLMDKGMIPYEFSKEICLVLETGRGVCQDCRDNNEWDARECTGRCGDWQGGWTCQCEHAIRDHHQENGESWCNGSTECGCLEFTE